MLLIFDRRFKAQNEAAKYAKRHKDDTFITTWNYILFLLIIYDLLKTEINFAF